MSKTPIRNIVTGGAGFLGSHLVEKLINNGEEVICIDNFSSGNEKNIEHWINDSRFSLIRHDIEEPIEIKADRIWHLACSASTAKYQKDPIKTSKTNFIGTLNMLQLSKKVKQHSISIFENKHLKCSFNNLFTIEPFSKLASNFAVFPIFNSSEGPKIK